MPRPQRRRPALPSGYEPPDYLVVPVRLADGRVLHVNADDLADPRYVNVRNLNPDGTPVKGRAGLQARAVFNGATLLAQPWYGTDYRPEHAGVLNGHARHTDAEADGDFAQLDPADVVKKLFQQAERAGVHLTPQVAEGLALGQPQVMGYVADLIAQLGERPVVEPRQQGGSTVPGRNYLVNEVAGEQMVGRDGQVRPVGDGRPAVVQARRPGVILPGRDDSRDLLAGEVGWDPVAYGALGWGQLAADRTAMPEPVEGMPWTPPHWDNNPPQPGSLSGPMPVMPYTGGKAFYEGLKSPYFADAARRPFNDVSVDRHRGGMAVEFDGSHLAYGPPGHGGQDDLRNAWQIKRDAPGRGKREYFALLTTDRHDKTSPPVVQKAEDPNPGGYISTSSLHADWTKSKPADPQRPRDPKDPGNQLPANAEAARAASETAMRRRRADEIPGYYASATETPFIAVAYEGSASNPRFEHGKPGDYVTVVDNQTGRYVHGVVGDARKNSKSEASIEMARRFGLKKSGSDDKTRFSYFVYKGSGRQRTGNGFTNSAENWPLTSDQIQDYGELFRQMTPQVQEAIDAGYARRAAERQARDASVKRLAPHIESFGPAGGASVQIPGWESWQGPAKSEY